MYEYTKLLSQVSDEDMAWFTGLFEGEGTVWQEIYYKENSTKAFPSGRMMKFSKPRGRLKICMTDREPLDRCAQLFGRRVCGPFTRKNHPEYKPHYIWRLDDLKHTDIIDRVARRMWKFLSPRRREQFAGIVCSG